MAGYGVRTENGHSPMSAQADNRFIIDPEFIPGKLAPEQRILRKRTLLRNDNEICENELRAANLSHPERTRKGQQTVNRKKCENELKGNGVGANLVFAHRWQKEQRP